mmetsp:Transcript_112817/g.195844  ORF Transcript_112817/g.195844 Transcript_112817/m.195844 type:complete len:221 (-) Transcript_112817:123-785(-)
MRACTPEHRRQHCTEDVPYQHVCTPPKVRTLRIRYTVRISPLPFRPISVPQNWSLFQTRTASQTGISIGRFGTRFSGGARRRVETTNTREGVAPRKSALKVAVWAVLGQVLIALYKTQPRQPQKCCDRRAKHGWTGEGATCRHHPHQGTLPPKPGIGNSWRGVPMGMGGLQASSACAISVAAVTAYNAATENGLISMPVQSPPSTKAVFTTCMHLNFAQN